MVNGKRDHKWHEPESLFQISIQDIAYDKHPERRLLDSYARGYSLSQGKLNISNEREWASFVAGTLGWTDSAISSHLLTCAQCRVQIKRIRIVVEKEYAEQRRAQFWQQLEEKLIPRRLHPLKRPALALMLMVFFVAVLFFVQQPDQGNISLNHGKGGSGGTSMGSERPLQVSGRLF